MVAKGLWERHAVTVVAIAAVAFCFAAALLAWMVIAGAFAAPRDGGGWFFAYQEFFGAVLGATGTVFAGWLAFRASERSHQESRKQLHQETLSRLITVCGVVAYDTASIAAVSKTMATIGPPPSDVGTVSRALMTDIMAVHPQLGAGLMAVLMFMDRLRQGASEGSISPARLAVAGSTVAFQAALLSSAFVNARRMLQEGRSPDVPFLSPQDIEDVIQETQPANTDLGPLEALVKPHE